MPSRKALGPVARGDLVRRDADIGKTDAVARQLQIDVVWIVAQRRIEESEVRGDTAERAGAATIRGEDGVGRGRRVVAGPGQYLDRAAIDGRRAGGDDLVGLASRVGLDLIDRVRVEQDIAGDVERADRIARCDRARNCGIADCANSPQATVGEHVKRPAERTIDCQRTATDDRLAGERAGVGGQDGRAIELRDGSCACELRRECIVGAVVAEIDLGELAEVDLCGIERTGCRRAVADSGLGRITDHQHGRGVALHAEIDDPRAVAHRHVAAIGDDEKAKASN